MEGKGEEGRGVEGPIQYFCPRAQLVVWPPLVLIIVAELPCSLL
jgi:hypothetical protein